MLHRELLSNLATAGDNIWIQIGPTEASRSFKELQTAPDIRARVHSWNISSARVSPLDLPQLKRGVLNRLLLDYTVPIPTEPFDTPY